MSHIDTTGFTALMCQQLSVCDPQGRFTHSQHDVERAAWHRQDLQQKAEISMLREENKRLSGFLNFAEAQIEYWRAGNIKMRQQQIGRRA